MLIVKKIVRRVQKLVNDYKRDIHFSGHIAVVNLLNNLTAIRPLEKIHAWCSHKRNDQILDYLYRNSKAVFDAFRENCNRGEDSDIHYIWVCWLQREDRAPPLVKKCIHSVKENAGDCTVVLVDNENYQKYVDIDEKIIQKYQAGKIGAAHFSDILRVNLIKKYGGLWIDATIYCTKPVPKDIFGYSFFSCKSEGGLGNYISEYQWTTFLLGGKRNSVFYNFMSVFYESYWLQNDCAIDYLIADYAIYLAKQHIPEIAKEINRVPLNNLQGDELQNIFNDPFDQEKYDSLMNSDTCFFKLSWRMEFREVTKDGRETFYGHFLKTAE